MPKAQIHYGIKISGSLLTKARISAGMSMQDVVEAMQDGCNRSSVSRWEQGTLAPSDERIEKLVKLYGTRTFILEGDADSINKRNALILKELGTDGNISLVAKTFNVSRWYVYQLLKQQKA